MSSEAKAELLSAHYDLLTYVITTQLGNLAGSLVKILAESGEMSLKELADAVRRRAPSFVEALHEAQSVRAALYTDTRQGAAATEPTILTDAAIKEIMTRLVLHRVVRYSDHTHAYNLLLGYGLLLRVLFPLVQLRARQRFGAAGEAVIRTFHQLAALPYKSAVQISRERHTTLAEASIAEAAAELRRCGWIESITQGAAPASPPPATAGTKRPRELMDIHVESDDSVYRISIEVILCELLHQSIQQLAEEKLSCGSSSSITVEHTTDALPAVILSFMAAMRLRVIPTLSATTASGEGATTSSPQLRPHGFPVKLSSGAASSVQLSAAEMRAAAPNCPTHQLHHVLLHLSSPTHPPMLTETSGAVEVGLGLFRMNYPLVAVALQRAVAERIIYARHGVVGLRLTQLLLQHHLLEDRTLAEAAISTQPKTREVLHAMMREGYVSLRECPRSGAIADRAPKQSIYLWHCSLEAGLLPAAREHIAKSLHQAIFKLTEMERQMEQATQRLIPQDPNQVGAAFSVLPSTTRERASSPSGDAVATQSKDMIDQLVRAERGVLGLQSSVLSLMRMLFVVDFC